MRVEIHSKEVVRRVCIVELHLKGMDKLRAHAGKIVQATLGAANPEQHIRNVLLCNSKNLQVVGLKRTVPTVMNSSKTTDSGVFNFANFGKVIVAGAGKAASQMAYSVTDILERAQIEIPVQGIVVTKHGHVSDPQRSWLAARNVTVREGGHPVPDNAGIEATLAMTEMLSSPSNGIGKPPLVIYCISGGGSSLTCVPAKGLSISDVQTTVSALLSCGATINELNAIRKHISSGVQGGRVADLLQTCGISSPHVVSLVLSDVVGDPLDVISSGPTTPDTSTFVECLQIISKYQLDTSLPKNVLDHLAHGAQSETKSKVDFEIFANFHHVFVGNNRLALRAAKTAATKLSYDTHILTSKMQGEAKEVAKLIGGIVAETCDDEGDKLVNRPGCILLGGETTVDIQGKGLGGRNQELALALAIDLNQNIGGDSNVLVVCIGTDGNDGPTDAAGAWVTPQTVSEFPGQQLPSQYLSNNDSYHFFSKFNGSLDQVDDGALSGLIKTGPTGTNVMDVVIVLIGEKVNSND